MNLAELYAEANQRNMLARRNEPLDAPVYRGDPLRGLPPGQQRWGDVASLAMQNAPGLGDVASLLEAYKAWKAGDTTGGLLSGLAALPMVGAIKLKSPTRYYHQSPDNSLAEIAESLDAGKGDFGGIFVTDSPRYDGQYGDYRYTVDVPKGKKLAEFKDIKQGAESGAYDDLIRAEMPWISDAEDIGNVEGANIRSLVADSGEKFIGDMEGWDWFSPDEGEAAWKAQAIRSKIAKAMGFDGLIEDDGTLLFRSSASKILKDDQR